MFLFLFPVSVRIPPPPYFLPFLTPKKKSHQKKTRFLVPTAFQWPQWRMSMCTLCLRQLGLLSNTPVYFSDSTRFDNMIQKAESTLEDGSYPKTRPKSTRILLARVCVCVLRCILCVCVCVCVMIHFKCVCFPVYTVQVALCVCVCVCVCACVCVCVHVCVCVCVIIYFKCVHLVM